jgi:hypothetical protein
MLTVRVHNILNRGPNRGRYAYRTGTLKLNRGHEFGNTHPYTGVNLSVYGYRIGVLIRSFLTV